ncbi:MAG TPA: type II toxin-antitoxin system VapC family toxin [Rhizomicrobium sp.]
MILVDSSVVLDLLTDDPNWASWSEEILENLSLSDSLVINDVIYAEISVGYRTIEKLEGDLALWNLRLTPIPRLALFEAGKTYRKYRSRAGTKTGVLPDFFIGAHAAVEGWPLLTRDVARIRTNFPSVTLIAPER